MTLTPLPPSRVLVAEMPGGESVVFDLDSEGYLGLDELGTAVWTSLSTGVDLDTLIADTATATGVDAGVIRADVDALLEELTARGLVVGS